MNVIIQQIKQISLHDGDLLVLKTDEPIDNFFLSELKDQIEEITGAKVGILKMGLQDGVDVIKVKKVLRYKKLTDYAIPPQKGTSGAAGFDLFTCIADPHEVYILKPGQLVSVSTGLALEIPEGLVGWITNRSSAFKRGLEINGKIDCDYRGEIVLQIRNVSNGDIAIEANKAYAQLILLDYNSNIVTEQAMDLTETERGSGAFGSTGNT